MVTRTVRRPSAIEEEFALACRVIGLPAPVREYRFHPPRRFRFDFAWPALKIAVECEGGVWTDGRHVRGRGFLGDCEKYNLATRDGWRVFRVGTGMDMVGFVTMLERVIRRG